jgi:RND family efflux transporter MFP subunit
MLGYASITAPFDGIVTQRNVDTGHFVLPGSGSSARPLLVVARNGKLRVVVEVPEAEAALVTPGDQAVVRVPALAGREVPGEVSRTGWALESANRSLRTEIDLMDADGLLRPGTYATVRIELETHPDVLTVPVAAIVHENGQTLCCCVVDGHVARRPVVIGLRSGDRVEVVSGLGTDDLVVQQRADSLKDGQAVEVLSGSE